MRTLFHHISTVISPEAQGPEALRGQDMDKLIKWSPGSILIDGAKIVGAGPSRNFSPSDANRVIDCSKKNLVATPGFIDPHTHAIFGGHRADEFRERCKGTHYLDIAKAGGGIQASVRMTREATRKDLQNNLVNVLKRMRSCGATTVEVKSGYGLNWETEKRLLDILADTNTDKSLPHIVPTFMGAHACPSELSREAYIQLILEKMIPEVASSNLAQFVDIFCEDGAYSYDETKKIMEAAQTHGLGIRVHSDEFKALGGTTLAASMHGASADHLIRCTDDGIDALAKSSTVATLLPGTSFYLREPYAPYQKMREKGVAVALGTDFNPGSCHCDSILNVMTIACTQYHMSPEAAIVATTHNAAVSLGYGGVKGIIAENTDADIAFFDVPSWIHLIFRMGAPPPVTVFRGGECILNTNSQFLYDNFTS